MITSPANKISRFKQAIISLLLDNQIHWFIKKKKRTFFETNVFLFFRRYDKANDFVGLDVLSEAHSRCLAHRAIRRPWGPHNRISPGLSHDQFTTTRSAATDNHHHHHDHRGRRHRFGRGHRGL